MVKTLANMRIGLTLAVERFHTWPTVNFVLNWQTHGFDVSDLKKYFDNFHEKKQSKPNLKKLPQDDWIVVAYNDEKTGDYE